VAEVIALANERLEVAQAVGIARLARVGVDTGMR
jgi:hypothetical protein